VGEGSSPISSELLQTNLRDFFHGLICEAASDQRFDVSVHAKAYVTEVLVTFHETAKLFAQNGVRVPVLADMLQDALEADFYKRVNLLKQMGDTSLMVSGYFPEALSRRAVDLDYYRKMGEIAYSQVGALIDQQSIFDELSEQFFSLSRLVAKVSEVTTRKNISLTRLMELYRRTGSDLAFEKLKLQGVIPISRGPKNK